MTDEETRFLDFLDMVDGTAAENLTEEQYLDRLGEIIYDLLAASPNTDAAARQVTRYAAVMALDAGISYTDWSEAQGECLAEMFDVHEHIMHLGVGARPSDLN